MAQLHKGKRDTSTFAVPLELKERIEAAAKRHGYKKAGVYLTDLISALHPEHRQQPELAASIRSMIPMLLARAPELASNDRHVFATRTRVGVKDRIKSAYTAFGYSHMTAYLVALISALHPAPPKRATDRNDRGRNVPALTPEATHSLVRILLNGGVDTPLPNADSTSRYEQQAVLDRYDLERPQQTAA
ncbi:hypothetical protein [Nonomuraea sp. SYSU D8015]|uniref:hypothetical protein n=1 Tax=Nonomuraea sp. SYSU D8015 TaxID=2593644 RepID=UPI0016618384|nr:hypothetical protein [Nonomuraea sp. SYSU D8015]